MRLCSISWYEFGLRPQPLFDSVEFQSFFQVQLYLDPRGH